MESRDLVLDGQLVSMDTVKSIGPTAVNKYPNTRTGSVFGSSNYLLSNYRLLVTGFYVLGI